jgi:hypothetical protein
MASAATTRHASLSPLQLSSLVLQLMALQIEEFGFSI